MELIRIAEILIEKIKKDYPKDISLVHVHGSYIYNDTHNLSDLDLYFVPKTERGYNLGTTFILNGIGCDYWALSWERLERIANHEEKTSSIITEGKILYYNSDEDLARFNLLKEKASNINNKEYFLNNASEKIKDVYKIFFAIKNCSNISEIRKHLIEFIYIISFVLAELNCITIKRGRKYLKQEILAMPIIPKNFSELYDNLFLSSDINKLKEIIDELIIDISKLIENQQKDINSKIQFNQAFNGWYEEMIQSYNKIYHACEIGDIYTPLFASVEFTAEIEELFSKIGISPVLPDIVGAYDPNNLNKIAKTAKKHQEQFVQLLIDNGIQIKTFNDFKELGIYLNTL